jgi:O-antigen/teichoic acid export membrane protein
MTLRRNIVANYFGAGVIALSPIFALPWYLSALGPQQFGLVGFVLMLQAILGLVDAGMSQALVREIVVRFSLENRAQRSVASLLLVFERVYWIFAIFAGCLTLLLSNFIVTHWLSLGNLPVNSGKIAIYGAAVIFAVQFPGSVYRSLLVAAQAQVTLNYIMLSGSILRHLGAVIVVIVWPTLTAYLIWHALISLLETVVRGRFAWKILNIKRRHIQWEASSELLTTWKLIVSMSGATWLGALTVQMDKIILSRMATIEQFGYYTIAATVATGALQLIYPVVQAFLPQAIQLREEPAALRKFSIKLLYLIGLLAILGTLFFIVAGKWLLNFWVNNPIVVESIYPLLAVLLVGTAINAFYNIGYINWLVNEKAYRVFQVNALALLLAVTLIPFFIIWHGTIGAAFGWLVINLIGFILSLEWLRKK